jgi:hypothetical protein
MGTMGTDTMGITDTAIGICTEVETPNAHATRYFSDYRHRKVVCCYTGEEKDWKDTVPCPQEYEFERKSLSNRYEQIHLPPPPPSNALGWW